MRRGSNLLSLVHAMFALLTAFYVCACALMAVWLVRHSYDECPRLYTWQLVQASVRTLRAHTNSSSRMRCPGQAMKKAYI